MALGRKPAVILGQVIAESLILLGIGLLIGDILAWATVQPLRGGIDLSVVSDGMEMMGVGNVLTPSLRASDVVLATVVVLVLGIFASLFPAVCASRYHPAEAITMD